MLVGGAFIAFEGSDYDYNVILLGIKLKFPALEQLISCGEVLLNRHLVADGGTKDHFDLDEGDCVAGKEVAPDLFWLVRHTWVR